MLPSIKPGTVILPCAGGSHPHVILSEPFALEAGRAAFESGLGAQSEMASATSSLTGFLD